MLARLRYEKHHRRREVLADFDRIEDNGPASAILAAT